MVAAELGGLEVRQGKAWAGNRGFLRGGEGRGTSPAPGVAAGGPRPRGGA
jgi:hypothetical protein